MRRFNKAAVIGVGLIGGSVALKIRKEKLAREIVGVSSHKQTLEQALKKGAIDKGSLSLDIIKGADLLIFSAPVKAIVALAVQAARFVDKSCFVTDVGSTKEEVVRGLSKAFPNYVGSHPLAGSERRGIQNASADIFEDSVCILTPVKDTPEAVIGVIKAFWAKMGAKTILLDPRRHDKVLGFTSHMPHAAAFSLINAIPAEDLKFSGAGLKDSSRIAGSDPDVWADIFLSNDKNLLKGITALEFQLREIKTAVKNRDRRKLLVILEKARRKRLRI